ncbi:DUF222 domain-containing protein [Kribbella sp. NPDC048915]|uniref:HNH endonuclease n=1 Tax=Kribbella sp. NPDC048915 TaxID=3155148 RepID=UPI0033DA3B69
MPGSVLGMELLGERPAWSMSGGELLSTLDALEAEIARLESYRLRVIDAVETTGYATELGARDTAELIRFRYRLDSSTAHATVRLARALSKYPAVSAGLDETIHGAPTDADSAGETDQPADESDDAEESSSGIGWSLRPAQAAAIVSALDRVPTHVPVADRDAAEQQLVKLAAHLSPGELRSAGRKVRDILDTDGPEPEEHKAYERESLILTNADRGVKFRGYLANENAELLRSLIHAGARPHKTIDGEHDPRSREKRQADALTNTLNVAAAAYDANLPTSKPPANLPTSKPPATQSPTEPTAGTQDDPWAGHAVGGSSGALVDSRGRVPGFGAKAHLTVTIDFEDLKAAVATGIGQTVYGDGLSAATVRRLACDAKIIPLVLGSNSEPLDVGRSERLVTKPMRYALNRRDRGCVVCGAPPIMCEAHHLVSWIDGGETKGSNLVLLCRRHHKDLHAGRWRITIIGNEVHVRRPTWAEPPAHRRRRIRGDGNMSPEPPPPDASATTTPPASPPADDSVVPITRRPRWKADEAMLREADAFAALPDTPAS